MVLLFFCVVIVIICLSAPFNLSASGGDIQAIGNLIVQKKQQHGQLCNISKDYKCQLEMESNDLCLYLCQNL